MSKSAFDKIISGIDDAGAILRGDLAAETYRVHVPSQIDVARIRQKMGLTQVQFAARFGFSLSTLKKWEQEGREPEGPARAYLTVIDRNPTAVEMALREPGADSISPNP